jgi:hypothetical protein
MKDFLFLFSRPYKSGTFTSELFDPDLQFNKRTSCILSFCRQTVQSPFFPNKLSFLLPAPYKFASWGPGKTLFLYASTAGSRKWQSRIL